MIVKSFFYLTRLRNLLNPGCDKYFVTKVLYSFYKPLRLPEAAAKACKDWEGRRSLPFQSLQTFILKMCNSKLEFFYQAWMGGPSTLRNLESHD